MPSRPVRDAEHFERRHGRWCFEEPAVGFGRHGKKRADAVAVATEESREHSDELARHAALFYLARAEVDRRTQVEQEPGGDVAILVVLAHVRRGQTRGDVPIDVPDVVVILVFAQVGEIEPEAAEERPIVAVQQAVESPQHRPLEPAQHALGVARRVDRYDVAGFRTARRP